MQQSSNFSFHPYVKSGHPNVIFPRDTRIRQDLSIEASLKNFEFGQGFRQKRNKNFRHYFKKFLVPFLVLVLVVLVYIFF